MPFEDKKKSYMDTLFSISTLLKRWQIEIQNKDVDKNYMLKRLGQWIEMLESLRNEMVKTNLETANAIVQSVSSHKNLLGRN